MAEPWRGIGFVHRGEVTADPTLIEFVYAEAVFNTGGGTNQGVSFDELMDILPGDYMLILLQSQAGATAITDVPSWLTRLDGGTDAFPALYGGFPPVDGFFNTGISINDNLGIYFETNSTTTSFTCGMALYRNCHATQPYDYLRDDTTTAGDTAGPIDSPEFGMAVLMLWAATSTATANLFETDPEIERLSVETSASFNRGIRVYDLAGEQTAFNFVHDGGLHTTNATYVLGLSANGTPTYDPQNTISYVGAGAGVNTSGTTITVPLPASLQAGDLIICVVHHNQNDSAPIFNDEAGWIKIQNTFSGSSYCVFIKRAIGGGSDSDPTFDSPHSAGKNGLSVAYRNVAGLVKWQTNGFGQATTLTPDVVTWVDNVVAIAMCSSDFYQPVAIDTANGYTQRAVQNHASNGGLILCDKTVAVAGNNPDFPIFTAGAGGVEDNFMKPGLIYLVPN